MNKVAIYCRLSDEDRNKKTSLLDSGSIQNQKNLLMNYAIEKGWDIYKIYSDDDYSGLDSDRPEFNQMLKDAKDNKFNIILCKHQSRFTRDMELVEKYLHNKFIEWGIRFVTVVDAVDTSDKHNKKSRQINGLINEWYSEDISESIKSVFKLKQQQGKFIGSFATYGYDKSPKDKNKLIIDEAAAENVHKIFTLYLNGYGTQKIAQILNELNIPNPTKYKQLKGYKYTNVSSKNNIGLWNKTTVKRILKNQMYLGNMVQHMQEKTNYKSNNKVLLKPNEWFIVPNTHSQIIDKATFDIVAQRLKSKTRSSGEGKAHALAGKVKCMDCGRSMVKNSSSTSYRYLRCSLHTINPKLCSSHSIRLDKLEQLVNDKLKLHLMDLDENKLSSELLEEASTKIKINFLEKQVNNLEKEILNRNLALKALYLDKLNNVISEQQFIEFTTVFTNERNESENRKEAIKNKLLDIESSLKDANKYKKLIKNYKNQIELNPVIANELLDYIEVGERDIQTKEQKIKIHWLF